MGASTAFHLATGGVADVVAARARDARERLDLALGRRRAAAVRRRAQRAALAAQPRGVRALGRADRRARRVRARHRVPPGRLPLPARHARADVETFRAALAVQHAHGVPSRELTPAEALEIVPQLELDGVLAATFCPRDGHMSPEAVVQGYAAAAVARGAQVVAGLPGDRDRARRRPHHRRAHRARARSPPTPSCAPPGAWSREIGAMVGLEIPVHGEPRHMWFSPERGGLRDDLPLTIDFTHELLLPRRGAGHRLRRPRGRARGGRRARARAPAADRSSCRSRAAGGATTRSAPTTTRSSASRRGPGRFLYATGFSGHGFQQSPAIGEHLAQLVRGEQPAFDLGAFALERFARGEQRAERFVV